LDLVVVVLLRHKMISPSPPSSSSSSVRQLRAYKWRDESNCGYASDLVSTNSFFVLAGNDFLGLGGGGSFALFLDGELKNGSTAPCATFNCPSLATQDDFLVYGFEVWSVVSAAFVPPEVWQTSAVGYDGDGSESIAAGVSERRAMMLCPVHLCLPLLLGARRHLHSSYCGHTERDIASS